MLPGLNKHLEKGFPLPIIDHISFVNPMVQFNSGFVVIATDVSYNASSAAIAAAAQPAIAKMVLV